MHISSGLHRVVSDLHVAVLFYCCMSSAIVVVFPGSVQYLFYFYFILINYAIVYIITHVFYIAVYIVDQVNNMMFG